MYGYNPFPLESQSSMLSLHQHRHINIFNGILYWNRTSNYFLGGNYYVHLTKRTYGAPKWNRTTNMGLEDPGYIRLTIGACISLYQNYMLLSQKLQLHIEKIIGAHGGT